MKILLYVFLKSVKLYFWQFTIFKLNLGLLNPVIHLRPRQKLWERDRHRQTVTPERCLPLSTCVVGHKIEWLVVAMACAVNLWAEEGLQLERGIEQINREKQIGRERTCSGSLRNGLGQKDTLLPAPFLSLPFGFGAIL